MGKFWKRLFSGERAAGLKAAPNDKWIKCPQCGGMAQPGGAYAGYWCSSCKKVISATAVKQQKAKNITDARLVVNFSAPSLELASVIAKGALNELNRQHPGAVQPNIDLLWLSKESGMKITADVRCASTSEAWSINGELTRLVAEHATANGVDPAIHA
jgi:hypothetical protein